MQIIAALLLAFVSASSYAQVESPATIESDAVEESSVAIEEETQATAEPVHTTWSLGTGLEARLQREVNPDYAEMAALGQLFVQVNRGAWGGQLEVSQEKRDTSSGAFHVDTVSMNAGLWGRHSILPDRRWHPYFSGGIGSYFDNVKSSYGSASIEKSGQRKWWGLGVGISRTFWRYMLVEAEGRGAFVEDRKDPVFSGLIRVGVQI